MKYKVKYCERTCDLCPSQWNIFTEDDKYIYVRYRWGNLQVDVANSVEDWEKDNYEPILEQQIGDEYDGHMTIDELKNITENIIDWNL